MWFGNKTSDYHCHSYKQTSARECMVRGALGIRQPFSMSFSGPRGRTKKAAPLDKKIPENPKYKHIKSTLDTGASLSKYLEHLEEIKRNYRYRKDEIFKRLKVTTFAQLVLQVADSVEAVVETPEASFEDPSIPQTSPLHSTYSDYGSPPSTARSTLSSVVAGVGEMDISRESSFSPVHSSPPHPPPSTCPYLLLDVRSKEEYEQCHIITAKSYPATMLSRSCNYFTKEILEYKNKPGRIIILYDEDERVASQAATTFVQREVDNVLMLSGGLKVLYKMFPEGMVVGVIPASCIESPPTSARKKLPTTGNKRAPKQPVLQGSPESTSHKDKFTVEDLDLIQRKLDDTLLTSSASSRASSRSSTAASRVASRTDSRASTTPWK